jgi:c-di-AMP phosphodiesterase-like protein
MFKKKENKMADSCMAANLLIITSLWLLAITFSWSWFESPIISIVTAVFSFFVAGFVVERVTSGFTNRLIERFYRRFNS